MTDSAELETSGRSDALVGERNSHGTFIWYELLTTDTDAAADFYGKVVGWISAPFVAEGGGETDAYAIFSAGADGVAGLMKNPMPTDPVWLGYVGVDDVDAISEKLRSLGGQVHKPAWDTEGVGRMAFVADPQGVGFYVMRGDSDRESIAFQPMAPGHCAWNELVTTDQTAALAFYEELFGWTKGDVMPMGELGDYQFVDHDGAMIGAVMNCPPDSPPPIWNYYFRVPSIAKAIEAIKANDGTITFGPQEVPGGDFVVNAIDPQGAAFGLVGAES